MSILQRAISDLGAISYGRGRYAYASRDEGSNNVYVVDSADMRDYGRRLARDEQDAYSLWCAATLAERLARADAEKTGLI